MPITPEQQARLIRLAALPDEAIDTTDIPEIPDWSDAVRGPSRRRPDQATTTPQSDAPAEPPSTPPHPTVAAEVAVRTQPETPRAQPSVSAVSGASSGR